MGMGIRPFTSLHKLGLRKFGVRASGADGLSGTGHQAPSRIPGAGPNVAGDSEVRQPILWSRDMEGTVGVLDLRIASEGFWRTRYGVSVQGMRTGTICTSAWTTLKLSMAMKIVPRWSCSSRGPVSSLPGTNCGWPRTLRCLSWSRYSIGPPSSPIMPSVSVDRASVRSNSLWCLLFPASASGFCAHGHVGAPRADRSPQLCPIMNGPCPTSICPQAIPPVSAAC